MFQQSLVESTSMLRSRNPWPAYLSIALQALAVAAILALPLLHPEMLPLGPARLSSLAPPPPPPPKPPPPPQHVPMQTASVLATLVPAPYHPAIPHPAPGTDAPPIDAPALPFGDANGRPSSDLIATLTAGGPVAPVVVAAPTAAHSVGPIHLSTGVTSGMLLAPIRPNYPATARLTRTEGTVIIQAVISTTGHIESAHVLSGPPLLQAAALEAVRAARYRPTC